MECMMAHVEMNPSFPLEGEPIQNHDAGTDVDPQLSLGDGLQKLDPANTGDSTNEALINPASNYIASAGSDITHEDDSAVPARPITKIWQGVKQRCKRMAYKLPDVDFSSYPASNENNTSSIPPAGIEPNAIMHVDTNNEIMFPQPLIDQPCEPSTSEEVMDDEVPVPDIMQQYDALGFNKAEPEPSEPGTSRVSLAELEAQAVLQCARMIAEERHPLGMVDATALDTTPKKRSRATMSPNRLEAVRKKQAERQRQTRAAMTADELEAFRKKQAMQKRLKRASLSPESLRKVREEQAARKRKAYAAMTPDQLRAFREKQATRKRQAYASMTPEQLMEFRKVQVQRKRKARSEMSDDQLQAFRDKQAAQKREARAKMTSEQLQRFREDQAERQRKTRASMSEDDLQELRDKQAAGKREKRLKHKITESIEHLAETMAAAQRESDQASPLDPTLLAPFADDWKNFNTTQAL